MNKQEYKRLAHDIRLSARKNAQAKNHTTRAELHNLFCWADDLTVDKFGKNRFTYICIGDYNTGLIWEKAW